MVYYEAFPDHLLCPNFCGGQLGWAPHSRLLSYQLCNPLFETLKNTHVADESVNPSKGSGFLVSFNYTRYQVRGQIPRLF